MVNCASACFESLPSAFTHRFPYWLHQVGLSSVLGLITDPAYLPGAG